jgi:hypothetical protein
MNARALGSLLLASSLLATAGCVREFTRERFETVRVGDSTHAVRVTLGEPAGRLDQQWFYDDVDDHYSAVIHFDAAGRVNGKEWVDARRGVWDGVDPSAPPPPPGATIVERRTTATTIDGDD